MQLIVESGATKTKWIVLEKDQVLAQEESQGLSPYFQSTTQIQSIITDVLLKWAMNIRSVFYYGTGVDGNENAQIIQRAFESSIPLLKSIGLFSDMMAAARASCQDREGAVCILGTGANSCIYDGRDIVFQKRGFGYILGDYGSGAVLGNTLVSDFLHDRMPDELMDQWKQNGYDSEHAVILEKTYRGKFPNRYLASFAPFASQFQNSPYIKELLHQHFQKFVSYLLNPLLASNRTMPISAVGSISFYFENQLREVFENNGYQLSAVTKDPSEGLIKYHVQNKSQQ
jgi:N-acetylglucosamine kinase-like BadF-type ATPase